MYRYLFTGPQQSTFPTVIVAGVVVTTSAEVLVPAGRVGGVLVLDAADATGVQLDTEIVHHELELVDAYHEFDVLWIAHAADRPELAGDTTSWLAAWSAIAEATPEVIPAGSPDDEPEPDIPPDLLAAGGPVDPAELATVGNGDPEKVVAPAVGDHGPELVIPEAGATVTPGRPKRSS